MENPAKQVRIPIADHGLHKHSVNVPRLFTTNFFEHIPVYSFDFVKGNKIDQTYSFFNRFSALPVPAIVTGNTKLYGFFCPMESIFKGWYDFKEKVKHTFADGTSASLDKPRYITMSRLNKEFVLNTVLVSAGTSSDNDILYLDNNNVVSYYKFTDIGAFVYKIFCALGMPLSFYDADPLAPNCLKVLAYLRVMYDHFFPLQYVGNSASTYYMQIFEGDDAASLHVNEASLLNAVAQLGYGYFDTSWLDSVWDLPVHSNVGSGSPAVSISDPTNNASGPRMGVYTSGTGVDPNASSSKPSNGTPFVGSTPVGLGNTIASGVLTQFVIDALQGVNNFVKRHGLSGNRLIENFLSSRGVSLPSGVYRESLKLDEYTVPFEINDVETNSEANGASIGELAGKGQSSGRDFRFRHRFDRDGIFFIIQACIPDSEPMMSFDPFNLCESVYDFRTAEYEKLGVESVASRILYQDTNGQHNSVVNPQSFGFFKRYFYGNVDVPLMFGDFRIINRGGNDLQAYHTFRSLLHYFANQNYNVSHSFDFLRVEDDFSQFNRIFYSKKADYMTVVARIRGKRWTNFLPFGDSYDWDDDEMNQKVVVQSSSNDSK